jgi:hypothetical protein
LRQEPVEAIARGALAPQVQRRAWPQPEHPLFSEEVVESSIAVDVGLLLEES